MPHAPARSHERAQRAPHAHPASSRWCETCATGVSSKVSPLREDCARTGLGRHTPPRTRPRGPPRAAPLPLSRRLRSVAVGERRKPRQRHGPPAQCPAGLRVNARAGREISRAGTATSRRGGASYIVAMPQDSYRAAPGSGALGGLCSLSRSHHPAGLAVALDPTATATTRQAAGTGTGSAGQLPARRHRGGGAGKEAADDRRR